MPDSTLVTCPHCHGGRAEPGTYDPPLPCDECAGYGRVPPEDAAAYRNHVAAALLAADEPVGSPFGTPPLHIQCRCATDD